VPDVATPAAISEGLIEWSQALDDQWKQPTPNITTATVIKLPDGTSQINGPGTEGKDVIVSPTAEVASPAPKSNPDFVVFNPISISVVPGVSVGPSFTMTKDGRTFVGPSLTLGVGLFPATSVAAGWVADPSKRNDFAGGWNVSTTGFFGQGGGISYSPGVSTAVVSGIGLPQVGVSVSLSFEVTLK
jgi:hypothetical protein